MSKGTSIETTQVARDSVRRSTGESMMDSDDTPVSGSIRPGGASAVPAAAGSVSAKPKRRASIRRLRRPSVLAIVAWLYVLWTLLPLAALVRLSLNSSAEVGAFSSASTRWYTGTDGVLSDGSAFNASLTASLQLAGITIVVAVPLGLLFAIGTMVAPLRRWYRLTSVLRSLPLVAAVVPTLLVGAALLAASGTWFGEIVAVEDRGAAMQLLGHVAFSTALVALIAQAQWTTGTAAMIDVARDLGATRWEATRVAISPALVPTALVGVLVAAAASLDDIGIAAMAAQIDGAPGSNELIPTASLAMYEATLDGPTPAVFAVATLVLGLVVAATVLTAAVLAVTRSRRTTAATATVGAVRSGLYR